jgi:hypothetical protein
MLVIIRLEFNWFEAKKFKRYFIRIDKKGKQLGHVVSSIKINYIFGEPFEKIT